MGINDIFLKQNQPSGGVFFGYKINDKFQTGFSYRNDINFKLDMGMMIITNEFGQILDSANLYNTFNTHTFTFPFVYKTKFINAGININYILYAGYEMGFTYSPTKQVDLNTTFGRFVPEAGIQISLIPELTFGMTYSQGFDKKIVKEWSTVIPNTINDTTDTHFPSKFGAGVSVKLLNEMLKLSADFRFENTSRNKYLKDRYDYYFGVEYSFSNNWKIRTGFFTLFDFRDEAGNYADPVGTYDQYFLTFGWGYKYKDFGFDLSFMNSTIFSDSKVGHSNLNGSVSYNF